MFALKTFLNSSYEMVPDSSLHRAHSVKRKKKDEDVCMTLLARCVGKEVCVHVEILERYPIVRVRSLQDGLKHHKVIPRDEPAFVGVRDAEERRELRPADLVQVALRRDGLHELLAAQIPAQRRGGGAGRREVPGQRGAAKWA